VVESATLSCVDRFPQSTRLTAYDVHKIESVPKCHGHHHALKPDVKLAQSSAGRLSSAFHMEVYGDFKPVKLKFDKAYQGQLAIYAQALFLLDPDRNSCVCFLAHAWQVQFFRFDRKPGGMKAYYTEELRLDEPAGQRMLLSLLSLPPLSLGHHPRPPLFELAKTASPGGVIRLRVLFLIGRGGSCTAYEAREADDLSVDPTKTFVMKLFAPEKLPALQSERMSLQALPRLAGQKQVPTEIACGEWENMSILVVAPRGERFSTKRHQTPFPFHGTLRLLVALTPRRTLCAQMVGILQVVHEKLVHRDVKLSNVLFLQSENQVRYLFVSVADIRTGHVERFWLRRGDWFAEPLRGDVALRSRRRPATAQVAPKSLICSVPRHDLESLVKTWVVKQLEDSQFESALEKATHPAVVLQIWQTTSKHFPFAERLLAAARAQDYSALRLIWSP
jgi:hypothetical protein